MAPQPLDVAYRSAIKANRARTERFILEQFTRGQHRDADVTRFISTVVPVALASRRTVSALTDSYLAQRLTRQTGRPVRPRGPIDTAALRGVDATEVYQRPYQTVWQGLSEARSYEQAVQAGVERLADIVRTDLQMAKTYTSQDVLSSTRGVTGFAREISGDNTCALCAIASTQRYSRGDLLPIHPGCNCDVVPITEDSPWDQEAAQQRLADTHAEVERRLGVSDAGGRDVGLGTGRDYTKLVVTHSHGEIGPVLAVKGQRFTGPTQIAKFVDDPLAARLRGLDAQIAGYERVLAEGGGTDWMRAQMPRLYAERTQLAN